MQIPNLIIKSKHSGNVDCAHTKIVTTINNSIIISANKEHKNGENGSRIIECKNTNVVAKFKEQLTSRMGEEYEINTDKITNPGLAIYNIEEFHSCEQLQDDINIRHFSALQDKVQNDSQLRATKTTKVKEML